MPPRKLPPRQTPNLPGADVPTDLAALPWEQIGAGAGAVVICLFLIWMFRDVLLAVVNKPTPEVKRKDTPEGPGPRTLGWMQAMSASQIKAQADESQDDRLDRLEAQLDRMTQDISRLGSRVDDCFQVEGKHREELLGMLRDLTKKLERLQDRSNDKNEKQDRLINGLSTSLATLQGMIAAKRGNSGVTQFVTDTDKE